MEVSQRIMHGLSWAARNYPERASQSRMYSDGSNHPTKPSTKINPTSYSFYTGAEACGVEVVFNSDLLAGGSQKARVSEGFLVRDASGNLERFLN